MQDQIPSVFVTRKEQNRKRGTRNCISQAAHGSVLDGHRGVHEDKANSVGCRKRVQVAGLVRRDRQMKGNGKRDAGRKDGLGCIICVCVG